MVNLQLTQDELEALTLYLERERMSNAEEILVHDVLLKIRMGKYSQVPVLGYLKMNKDLTQSEIDTFRVKWFDEEMRERYELKKEK